MKKLRIMKQFIAAFSATMSAFTAGCHFGWVAPSLPKLLADDSGVNITSDDIPWIVNFTTIGMACGPFIAMALVNRWGRKWSLLLTTVPFLLSTGLLGVAKNFWTFVVARFIAGISTSMTFAILPLYVGEIAEDRIRGSLCTLIILMMNVGILVTYCIGLWVSYVALAFMAAVPAVAFGLMFIWMPESPYYLMMKKQPGQAEKNLLWLRGTTNVKAELEKIRENIENDQKNAGTMRDLFMKSGNRKAVLIVVGLALSQHMTGIGAIITYMGLIFEASESNLNAGISVIIIGVVLVLSGVLATSIVDLTGRRPLLLLSIGGSFLCLVGGASYFQLLAAGIDVSSFAWFPITFVISFVIIYSIGLGCLPNIILVELVPINLKAPAIIMLSLAGCSASVTVIKLYQIVADSYGIHIAFWGFAVFSVFIGIFVFFSLPETRQKSFMEIQNELNRNIESSTV